MKRLIIFTAGVFISMGLYSFLNVDQTDEWVVPDTAKAVKNPTDASDKENIAIGKTLYSKYCKSCHGKEGYGDGPKAEELEDYMGDFSSEDFQSQTDGALFYKITTGKGDMPSFKKKIPDEEDRWIVIDYVRTLAEE